MGTFNANILPASTGLTLGTTAQRWSAYAQNVDIAGTLTLAGGVSGIVTLLNYQKSAAALVGSSSDQVMYTYALPASTLAAGKGIRITLVYTHSTGSASVLVKINVGGGSLSIANNALTVVQVAQTYFMNDPGSTVSNAMFDSIIVGAGSGSSFGTTSVNTGVANTITATFNVANTDQVTPQAFLVEIIQ